MSESKFNEPKIALNRIYTKTGDKGMTGLVGGQRIPKDSLRIECYGTIDELNSHVGRAAVLCESARFQAMRMYATNPLSNLQESLVRIQHELFNLGSILATMPQDVHPRQPSVTKAEVDLLESEIDEMNSELPSLRSFVLPGGTMLSAELHVCRTVARRAERLLVALDHTEDVSLDALKYLNRLSDAFFVMSRWANKILVVDEVLWEPNKAASKLSN